MEKSTNRKRYWAVLQIENGVKRLYEGTFSQCWDWFLKHYSEKTLTEIQRMGVYIGRVS